MIEKIKEVSKIITNKVSSSKISLENYISTENMISNFGGITIATSIPSGSINSFEENDILLSNIRPYFRKTWFSNMSGGCSTDIIVLRANTEYILPKYLFYIFNTDHFVKYYVSSCKGTKMPRGNKDALIDYKINLPDIETQQHIVDTIGSVDDLIENYQKQVNIITLLSIKIFEKFEQDFNLKFKDAFEVFNGGIFKSKDYATISKHKLITIKNVDEDGFNTTQTSYLSDQSIDRKYLLSIGDILLTMTGNIGRCGIVDEDNCYLNQRVLKVDCKSKLYLFCFLLKYKNDIVSLGRGTAQKNLSINDLYLLDVNNSISEISMFKNYDYLFHRLVNLKLIIKKLLAIKQNLLNKYFN